jgi:hypothetical protein
MATDTINRLINTSKYDIIPVEKQLLFTRMKGIKMTENSILNESKKRKRTIRIAVAVVILALNIIWIVPLVHNIMCQIKLNEFSQQLFNYKLPKETEKVREIWGCNEIPKGRTSYYAYALLKSNLEVDEIRSYYNETKIKPVNQNRLNLYEYNIGKVEDYGVGLFLDWPNKRSYIRTFYNNPDYNTYYVIQLRDED